MSILYTNFGVAAAVLLMLLLRRVLKNKFSAAIFIVLWLVVLLRVLVPVEIETPIGVFSAERTPKSYPAYELEHDAKQENAPAVSDNAQNALPNKNDARVEVKLRKYNSEQVIFCLRICGTAVFGLYFALCHLHTLRRCKNFEHSKDPVESKLLASLGCKRKIVLLESADVESPFSFGIIKPKIVLPAGCTKEQLLPVMAHEYVHIRDNDAVFKLIGLAAVCAAWFNPFVWIAFKYFDRDLERFCDEKVLRLLGFEHASQYARTLLDFAERQNRWAAMQSFTADSLEERIMGILSMKKRKTSKLLSVFTVAAVLVTMTACSTTALAEEAPSKESCIYGVGANSNCQPVGHKTVYEKYSVNHHFYRPITGETMGSLIISLDYSFDGISSKIDDCNVIKELTDGYTMALSYEAEGDTLTIDADCRTEDGKIFVHDIITVKTYPDSNVVKSHTDERTLDEEIVSYRTNVK